MLYDSLLLKANGGIAKGSPKVGQYIHTASLAIGIGGIGVASLSELKGKIHQQLIPDDPNNDASEYFGIQLLAVDSDETEFRDHHGAGRLQYDEFASIADRHMAPGENVREMIAADPKMNWMDLNCLSGYHFSVGAGGIRQIGRCLLFNRANEIVQRLQNKCRLAVMARSGAPLNVFVFAGLSGGTGSGCFLDVCYMLREIARVHHLTMRIYGLFFLPDVFLSGPGQNAKAEEIARNNANGYAALKELDYLMNLRDSNQWFSQQYGDLCQVNTQEPPVDMCHLISATDANGVSIFNGLQHSIQTATDYVIQYMEAVPGMEVQAPNLHMSVQRLPKIENAKRNYYVIGNCTVTAPKNEVLTYLATGFYNRFLDTICTDPDAVMQETIESFVDELQLSFNALYVRLCEELPQLQLPAVDMHEMARQPVPGYGMLPLCWAHDANMWLEYCQSRVEQTKHKLLSRPDMFVFGHAHNDSLIDRVFQKLCQISMDPERGPFYSAQILQNSKYDVVCYLNQCIRRVDEQLACMERRHFEATEKLEHCKQQFHNANFLIRRRAFEQYEEAIADFWKADMEWKLMHCFREVLYKFRYQLRVLYAEYFAPLCEMLKNLEETFRENKVFFTGEQMGHTNNLPVLSIADIKFRLDDVVEAIPVNELVVEFMINLLKQRQCWIYRDSDKIAHLIQQLMLRQFQEEAERNLETYLYEKYRFAAGSVANRANVVQSGVLNQAFREATPVFWSQVHLDHNYAVQTGILSVPVMASVIGAAAVQLRTVHQECVIRMIDDPDRVAVLRVCGGLPLGAYNGLRMLKAYYDKYKVIPDGAGLHLYANTGRCTDGTCRWDWINILPDPETGLRLNHNW